MSNVKQLIAEVQYLRYDETTDGIIAHDQTGTVLPPHKLIELAKGIMRTAEAMNQSNVDFEYEAEKRRQEQLYHMIGLPFAIRKNMFRTDLKRNWSFKCLDCDEKVSSKNGGVYYHLAAHTSKDSVYACSLECIVNHLRKEFPLLDIQLEDFE